MAPVIEVLSPKVKYEPDCITAEYEYSTQTIHTNAVKKITSVIPKTTHYTFRTKRHVPRVGLMMVGWGGNNGSTLTASLLAHKSDLSWKTRSGDQKPNFYGSMLLSSTINIGHDKHNKEIFAPLKDLVPLINPVDLVIGGWDINSANLLEAVQRAKVLEPDLIRQLETQLAQLTPLPAPYYPDFIASNQESRANNKLQGTKQDHLDTIRKDIRDFKGKSHLNTVIVVWTANTERYSELLPSVNDTADNLLASIRANHKEISMSTLFATASILENCPFINGSPQNTIMLGVLELAEKLGCFVGGDDFKTGQTKIKTVLADYLIGAGIKPLSIASYNHLGNNDGQNLSSLEQFRSKEISKGGVIDDLTASNSILYKKGEHPDHVIVIKYTPAVGDSKRALDEYENEIFMGGRSTIAIHNICEDSLLAAPILLDLVLLTELLTRIEYKNEGNGEFRKFHSIMTPLSYYLKAPLTKPGCQPVNSLFRQKLMIENLIRACVGLQPQNDLLLTSFAQ